MPTPNGKSTSAPGLKNYNDESLTGFSNYAMITIYYWKGGEDVEEKLIEISFSQLKAWRRCQTAHNFKYVQKLQKKAKSLPLYKGSVTHSCLEYHYKGDEWKAALKIFRKEFDKLLDEEKAVYGNLPSEVSRMMQGYQAYYKKEDWQVVTDKQGKPLVEREFKIRIPKTRIVVKGIIDLVVRDEYGIWVVDHKTVKKDPPSNEARMSDVQTTLYFWVALTLCEEWGIDPKQLRGAIFNYIRTQPPKEPELLKDGSMSKRNIDTCWMFYKSALLKAGLNPDNYRDMRMKLRGNEGNFYHRHRMDKPKALMKMLLQEAVFTAYQIEAFADMPARSLDKSCDWFCDYKDLCYAQLQGFDTDGLIRTLYERREEDGLEQRKKKEAKGLIDRDEI